MQQEYMNIQVTVIHVTGAVIHATGIQKQSITCISVNICNNDVRTWKNSVQSIYVTISSVITYPCTRGTWTEIIDIQCNNICVAVIQVHGMTVSNVISVNTKHNIQCTGVSSVLNDTRTDYNNTWLSWNLHTKYKISEQIIGSARYSMLSR